VCVGFVDDERTTTPTTTISMINRSAQDNAPPLTTFLTGGSPFGWSAAGRASDPRRELAAEGHPLFSTRAPCKRKGRHVAAGPPHRVLRYDCVGYGAAFTLFRNDVTLFSIRVPWLDPACRPAPCRPYAWIATAHGLHVAAFRYTGDPLCPPNVSFW
jgi:hypothetical protein